MAKTISKTNSARVVQNKNGTTSTYTKSKTSSGKTKWVKSGASSSNNRKKR